MYNNFGFACTCHHMEIILHLFKLSMKTPFNANVYPIKMQEWYAETMNLHVPMVNVFTVNKSVIADVIVKTVPMNHPKCAIQVSDFLRSFFHFYSSLYFVFFAFSPSFFLNFLFQFFCITPCELNVLCHFFARRPLPSWRMAV